MLSRPPYVSVLVPVYNSAVTLGRAVRSVLQQDIEELEVIVVDDASTDDGLERLRREFPQETRIVYLENSVNRGPAYSRNLAMRYARGRWLALLDADDSWAPHRLRTLLASAEGSDFVADNLLECDARTGRTSGLHFPPVETDELTIEQLLSQEIAGHRINAGVLKPIVRSEFVRRFSLTYDQELRFGEDLVFYFRALCEGARFRLITDALYRYTTRRGLIGRRGSRHRIRERNGELLAAKLRELGVHYRSRLSPSAMAALDNAAMGLQSAHEWWAFEAAVLDNPLRAIRMLVTRKGIRSRLTRGALRRLRARPPLPP